MFYNSNEIQCRPRGTTLNCPKGACLTWHVDKSFLMPPSVDLFHFPLLGQREMSSELVNMSVSWGHRMLRIQGLKFTFLSLISFLFCFVLFLSLIFNSLATSLINISLLIRCSTGDLTKKIKRYQIKLANSVF